MVAIVLGLVLIRGSEGLAAQTSARERVRIAVVADTNAEAAAAVIKTFSDRLAKLGYIEGRNLEIIVRLTEGVQTRLAPLMREVVENDVDLILTNGTPAAAAAKAATSRTPIVVLGMGDPVRAGLVSSLSHPGGTLTGLSMGFDQAFVGKWLELLQETVPSLKTVAVMSNPNNPTHRFLEADVFAAASRRALRVRVISVASGADLDPGFREARRGAQSAIVFGDAATLTDRRKVTEAAAKYRVPVMYGLGTSGA